MSHRGGCDAVTGAAAARREGPPGPARREGTRGGRGARGAAAAPALRSAGSSLQSRVAWGNLTPRLPRIPA